MMNPIRYDYSDFSATMFRFYDPLTFKENPRILIPENFEKELRKLHLKHLIDDFVAMVLECDNNIPKVCTLICFHQTVESTEVTCPPIETNWMFVKIDPTTAKFTMLHDHCCAPTKYGKEPYTDLQTFFVNEIYRPMQALCNNNIACVTCGLEESMDIHAEKILEKLNKSNILPEKQINIFELSVTPVFNQNTHRSHQKQDEEDLENIESSTDDQNSWLTFFSMYMYEATLYFPKLLGVEAFYHDKNQEWVCSGFSCICSKHELYKFIQKKTAIESIPAPGYVVDKTMAFLHETYSGLGVYGRIVQRNNTSNTIDRLPEYVLEVFEERYTLQ